MARSGYYRWLTRKDVRLEPRSQIDAEAEMLLVKSILDAYMKHSAFGYRKMGFYLRNQEGIENGLVNKFGECSSFCGHSLLASQKKGNNL